MQQTMSRPQPNMPPNSQNGGPARTQSLIITAITLFALSGLIIGFAVGAVTRPKQAAQPTAAPTVNPVAQKSQPTTAPKTEPQPLGCPIIDQSDNVGVADGTTIHTFQIHAVDKSGKCAQSGKAIEAPGITCKLWLSKSTDDALKGTAAVGTNIKAIPQPIKGEVENSLTFTDSQHSQTQMCDDKGHGFWKFSVSPTAKSGDYWLVVLADWDGKFYNLSWVPFKINAN
ncbi:hypothetical protein KSF_055870 [Reticulibacter mediterranei]|uniref:Uncharacterized protein n=1 Tax=Reticulibacter mediterranei TaxID=2778369 RepID=A0A8J3IPL9_9CHLR|nr:hypothetical protein [Reticulibacter mediterranei]GHO95539.1 hypothetical protein KSF_055870 [Reticulibacter mediterranei]